MTEPVNNYEIHIWHRCNGCAANPIVGRRFSCQTCPSGPDIDLCGLCYEAFVQGSLKHPADNSIRDSRVHVFREHGGDPTGNYGYWLEVPGRREPGPSVPSGCVLRPEFCCNGESYFGSHAFLVRSEVNSGLVLLTAFHVMDEFVKSQGLDCSPGNRLSVPDVSRLITRVNVYDVFSRNWMTACMGSAGPMINLNDARIGDEEPYSHRDIAAFHADRLPVSSALRLATAKPNVGETVWLVASSGSTVQPKHYRAVAVESTESTLIFRYADLVGARHTSGAPIVNRRGEVVGINCGAGAIQGHKFGHANPVTSIRRHLAETSV